MYFPRLADGCNFAAACVLALLLGAGSTGWADDHPAHAAGHSERDIRSVADGNWSNPKTWMPQRVPKQRDRVVIGSGTRVVYDVAGDAVIESIDVAGVLAFAHDRDTVLNVGYIKVGAGAGHDHAPGVEDVHKDDEAHPKAIQAALEVGTAETPIPAPRTARIRLHHVEGMNSNQAPAIVVRPGGRMDLHGAPMSRTWVKLGADAKPGSDSLTLDEPVEGWRAGDEVIVTSSVGRRVGPSGTYRQSSAGARQPETEERTIAKIEGATVTLDRPLEFDHFGSGEFRSEIANLTRTVIVESADPGGVRGHTMYHWGSQGSIGYARFAHLGKEATLGRYAIHFHLVEDTMRGSSVVGAAIVDSHNRWITIHGTHYMVVRDCVGYQSVGHGYFLEDATEVYNVLDRNLAVQAFRGKRMQNQELPFDLNDGAGYWWANGRNTFTRNVSCENDKYGYRYDVQMTRQFDCRLPIRQADGSSETIDVRTIPIWRFEDNEAHSEGFYGMVVAANGDRQPDAPIRTPRMLEQIQAIDWTGPDTRHPHVIRNLKLWRTHYAFRPHSPSMLVENLRIDRAGYGVYRPAFENQVYRNVHISRIGSEPFNRGMDDASAQTGRITVDGLRFEEFGRDSRHPLIQISDNDLSPDGDAASHFRNVELVNVHPARALVDRGGTVRVDPIVEPGVPVYLHDFFAPGRHAMVVSVKSPSAKREGTEYASHLPLVGDEAVVAEVDDVEFPELLGSVDDQPPATIVTWPRNGQTVQRDGDRVTIRGTATDNEQVVRVTVNGVDARDVDYHFHQWTATLTVKPGKLRIEARAEDAAGNIEQTPHIVEVEVR